MKHRIHLAVVLAVCLCSLDTTAAAERSRLVQQRQLRQKLSDMLGIPRKRCDLQPEFRGRFEHDGIIVEKWIFTSEPGSRIPSVFYRPKSPPGLMPAIMVTNGHGSSKSSLGQRYTGQLYAKLGIACLLFDTIGEEERHVGGKLNARAHDKPDADRRATAAGRLMMGKMVFDKLRGIDFLLTRKGVDPARIGVAGNSLGGATASWLSALDPRLNVAIISGACLGPYTAVVGHGKRCEYIPRQRMLKFCNWSEYMSLAAPHCAVMVMNGGADFQNKWDWAVTSDTVADAAKVYARLGSPGKIKVWYEAEAGHRNYHHHKEALVWLHRHLGTPGWSLKQIQSLPTITLGDWCKKHGINPADYLYGYQLKPLNHVGAAFADMGIRPFPIEKLKCLRPGELGNPEYTLQGWLDLIEMKSTEVE